MKNKIIALLILSVFLTMILAVESFVVGVESEEKQIVEKNHWLLLHRKSNREFLYFGTSGDVENSTLVKTFDVKSGIPNKAPTPLPNLLGRGYWRIIDKEMQPDSPDIGPHFLTLDIPTTEEWPYGPMPYEECGEQCDWQLPGYFGLHGIGGDQSRLSSENEGSLGCVRHRDEDMAYLYNVLNPKEGEIRYYIEDI